VTQREVDVVRFEALEVVPWANSGGTTRVVAVDPAADWAWRLSIADIEEPGAFSSYPGIDRVLIQLSDRRLLLSLDGAVTELGRFESVAFDGALPVSCEIPDGPTRDLNLMTRRGVAAGTVRVDTARRVVAVPGVGEAALAVVVDGSFTVAGEADPLRPFDTVRCGHSARIELTGPGTVVLVFVRQS